MIMYRYHKIIIFVFLFGLSSVVHAAGKPEWELGIGIIGFNIPDYIGSDRSQSYLFPIPYFVYRGDYIKVDRRGLLSEMHMTQHLKLDLSFNAGVPVTSDPSGVRSDMPDLDATFEVGPSLQYFFKEDRSAEQQWSLRLPARTIYATDLSTYNNLGWVFAPHLNYHNQDIGSGLMFGASLGPVYSTEKSNDYYYEVKPQFATNTRSVYDAEGGFNGWRFGISFRKQIGKYWFGGYARVDDVSDAVFNDSPLIVKNRTMLFGFGLSRVLTQSDRQVTVGE